MKGFMVYETPAWGDEENTVYVQEVNHASYTLKQVGSDDITCYLEGIVTKDPVTKATCNKDDTYDFEIGALIALMKKCGRKKSLKAVEELYFLYEPKGCDLDGDIFKDELQETTDCLNDLCKKYDEVVKYCDTLRESNKSLQEKNKRLNMSVCAKSVLNGKLLKDYNAAQSSYEIMVDKSADLMDEIKKLEEENEKLKKENYLWENSDKSLRREVKIVRDALNTWKKRYRDLNAANGDLVCENYKLKTDCEKLKHGYNDTDMTNPCPADWDGDILNMVFLPGRCCGKQYTALVNLFKKIDQKKVDAAYKEAYDTKLPLWQKEFFKQMCDIHKESKEKTDRKGVSLKDLSPNFKIDRGVMITGLDPEKDLVSQINKCLGICKPASKREKMWDEILKEGRTPIYVKREDIHDFLKECQVVGIKWVSGRMPLETIPFHMSYGYDGAYFFVMTSLDISKSKQDTKEFRHVMSWWMTASDEETKNSIKYIRPMRWDLFKKGRLVVKVNKENYSEFCREVLSHFDKVGISAFNHSCEFGYFVFNKDTDYVERLLVSNYGGTKEINGHKVVDWEDPTELEKYAR